MLDMTSFDEALKEHYTNDRVESLVYKNNPFLALLAKMEDFGGRNLPVPILFANPQGRSAAFATAQANIGNSQIKEFVLTRVNDHAVAAIANETVEASKGNSNAFMDAATTEIDGALHNLTRSLAVALYRNGSGSIGRLSATSGVTTTITLSEPEDITNFEVGMVLQLSTADGTGSLKTGTTTITDIDRDAGTMTVGTSLATFTAVGAVNDYIFVEGDHAAKIKGLDAWCPTSAPSATTFFGVDRTSDVTRLGGIRVSATGVQVNEALIDGAQRCGREGAAPDKAFMNYLQWAKLEKSLGTQVRYNDLKIGQVAFKSIQVNGPNGPIDVVADQNCPNNRIYLLQMNTWKLYSLGKVPRIVDNDGNKVLRQATADAIEVRCVYRAQLGCRAPGWNAVISLA